jgi:hypothetical protein
LTDTAIRLLEAADLELARSLNPSEEIPSHTKYADTGHLLLAPVFAAMKSGNYVDPATGQGRTELVQMTDSLGFNVMQRIRLFLKKNESPEDEEPRVGTSSADEFLHQLPKVARDEKRQKLGLHDRVRDDVIVLDRMYLPVILKSFKLLERSKFLLLELTPVPSTVLNLSFHEP